MHNCVHKTIFNRNILSRFKIKNYKKKKNFKTNNIKIYTKRYIDILICTKHLILTKPNDILKKRKTNKTKGEFAKVKFCFFLTFLFLCIQ